MRRRRWRRPRVSGRQQSFLPAQFPPHNVPTIKDSVEKLGFKFSDIKIILGSHAHGDHQEGDAMVKQMTGAQIWPWPRTFPRFKTSNEDNPIPSTAPFMTVTK